MNRTGKVSVVCKKEKDRESSVAQMPAYPPALSERNQKSLERKEFSELGMELC